MLIVSYDISNNKLRTHFSKFLKKHGRRIQYSVFELDDSDRILNIVLLEIEKKFQKRFDNADSILIVSLCEWCVKKTVRYGYLVQEEQPLVFM